MNTSVLYLHKLKLHIRNVFLVLFTMSACGHDTAAQLICDSAGDAECSYSYETRKQGTFLVYRLFQLYQQRTTHFNWNKGCVSFAGGFTGTARQETVKLENKRKDDERIHDERLFLSSYLTPGSPTLFFSWSQLFLLLHPDTLHCNFHLTLTWSNYSPAAQSYTSLQFCLDAVYVSSSICLSTCWASGNLNCLVQCPQGEDIVGCATRGGRWWRWRAVGGKETGAHFLWKWGYHFTNYYCNYCRSLGRKPLGMQMGIFKIISYSSCHSHFTAHTAWMHQTIRSFVS